MLSILGTDAMVYCRLMIFSEVEEMADDVDIREGLDTDEYCCFKGV